MQPSTVVAQTNAMTLEAVIARLAAHDAVDGILLMGSTGAGILTPASDYDLLLVLAELPVPLRMVNTWIDGRLTEVYCTTVRGVERIAADPAAYSDVDEEGAIAAWLRTGRIAHDRAGRLARAQQAARAAPPPALPGEREIYAAWLKIGYNVAQAKRYLSSDDPISQEAVDLRLLYSLMEVVAHYFTVRGLRWRGEKPALQYLAAHDPAYLDWLRQCLAETDRGRKVRQYEDLARLTLAPVGDVWAPGTTAVNLGPPYGAGPEEAPAGGVEDALAFWQGLIAGEMGRVGRDSSMRGIPATCEEEERR